MDELISRRAAIDELTKDKKELERVINKMCGEKKCFNYIVAQRNQVSYDISVIEHLPPARPDVPERDVGKWHRISNTVLASCECGFITDRFCVYKFCPNCGTDMRKEKNNA